MERYHAFPGAGDGDAAKALDVSRDNVFAYAVREGVNPLDLTVMRKDTTGQVGVWVKFDDAIKRSRKEYDEGYKQAKIDIAGSRYDEGYDAGLVKGRKEGQTKVDAISEISSSQLAAEFDRGHKAAISSKLVELIDSHKAESDQAAISDLMDDVVELEGIIDGVVSLLREYQDVMVYGDRGIELAAKLTAFVNENENGG